MSLMTSTTAQAIRTQLVGTRGIVERNIYLTKRYIWWDLAYFVWTVANTLTIVFIAEGVEATGGSIDVNRATTYLLIGAVLWAFLGVLFEILTETVQWERWEGTIEYTFMAPLRRSAHLIGMSIYAIVYGIIRAVLLFAVVAAFFDIEMPHADFMSALVVVLVASIPFSGIGMMTAVLPLISPEKGAQLGFVAQGVLLVVSGVYYPVDVMPGWMQAIASVSPATYALDGTRAAILEGAGIGSLLPELAALLAIGLVTIPLGMGLFAAGERYAKRYGKLKRSG
jgi:ABC-2 type transport system permease protein